MCAVFSCCRYKKGDAVASFLPKLTKGAIVKTKAVKLIKTCALFMALTLTACGGGSDEPQALSSCSASNLSECGGSNHPLAPAPAVTVTPGAEGLYSGTTSSGRAVTGLVLDDGSYYVIYSATNSPSLIAGAVVGTGTSTNGSFSSTDAKDINLEGLGLLSATLSASYVQKTSINGNITYPSLGQTVAFTGTYNAAYETTPTLAAIAGAYSGIAGSPSGTEAATITISASGALSGIGSSGCTITGSVAPRAKGNAYTATITFGGAPCLLADTSLTGAAYFDSATKRIYAIGVTSARTDGTIFVGFKP